MYSMLYAGPRLDRTELALKSQSLSQLSNDYNYGLWPHLISRLIYKSNIRSPPRSCWTLKK